MACDVRSRRFGRVGDMGHTWRSVCVAYQQLQVGPLALCHQMAVAGCAHDFPEQITDDELEQLTSIAARLEGGLDAHTANVAAMWVPVEVGFPLR